MWRVFKSHYGRLLGFSILLIVIYVVLTAIAQGIGFLLAANAQPDALAPVMWSACVAMALAAVVMYPISAYMYYSVLRRARGSNERAKSGRYGGLVLISIFVVLWILPGVLVLQASNPGAFSNWSANIAKIQDAVRARDQEKQADQAQQQGQSEKAEQLRNEAGQETDAAVKVKTVMPNFGMMALGLALMIIGGLVSLLWAPWAYLALLDPRTEATSAGTALRLGRQLNAPVRGAMYGGYIVVCLIYIGSLALCFLPAVFIGMPLALALAPGFYMAMRGENAGAAGA
jgi:heme/copper-type cytochrome/quinol oxidase subunit 2